MLHRFAFLFILLLSHTSVYADMIEGYVFDAETQQPIEGVNVRVENASVATTTGKHGRFILSLPTGSHELFFSRIGYQTLLHQMQVTTKPTEVLYLTLIPRAIEMDTVEVLALKATSEFEEMHQKTGVLTGDELEKKYSLTLAQTMKNETGVAIRSMGPAPARPVIRGLSGDRVQINQDGVQAHDLSATSTDHAVTLEPFQVESIEIIRGPRTLLYSSTAVGGVINVIKNKIPNVHPKRVFGSIGTYSETSNRGFLTSGALTTPMGPVTLYGETTYRDTRDLRTPTGILENTPINTHTYILGLSYVTPKGYVGASFDQFETQYGIPGGFIGGHPNGVDLDIVRRIFDGKAVYNFEGKRLHHVEAHFSNTFYHHFEFESNGNIGSEFLFRDYSANAKLYFNTFDKKRNTIASLGFDHRNLKLGGFVFTPPTRFLALSAGLYHEWAWQNIEWQSAARYGYTHFDPRPDARSNVGVDVDRTFHTWSASISPILPATDHFSIGLTFSRSARAPTIEELYNEGPHLAAYTFEVGRVDLDTENSLGVELFGHLKYAGFDWVLTGFWNEFDYFITTRNTGEINFAQLLPIYAADGIAARFVGVEMHVGWWPQSDLSLEINGSYVRGENLDDDQPLPEMPPLRVTGEVAYGLPWFTLGLTGEWVGDQNRVDTFELPTEGYAIGGGFLQHDFVTAHTRHHVVLSFDNVLNREYRNHLSRVRSVMPEPGRNIRLNYKMYFF